MVSCQNCIAISNNEETSDKSKLRDILQAQPYTLQKHLCHEIQMNFSKLFQIKRDLNAKYDSKMDPGVEKKLLERIETRTINKF